MTTKFPFPLLSVLLLSLLCIPVLAQEVIEWRGINRTGKYNSKNILKEWPAEGPNLLLHVDSLPESYSSVLMKDDLLYTTGIEDTSEILTAISMDGAIKWQVVYGKAWDNSYPKARCTPTIEGKYAYLISGSGYLACVDIEEAKLKWSFDGFTKFGAECGNWGGAESPLIVDDKMIYTPCGEKTTMVAVDKNTGETIWMSESIQDKSAYVSPIVIERAGYKLILTVTANNILCFNADDGSIMWKVNYKEIEGPWIGFDINPVTPVVVDNDIFVTSGYNHVGVMLHMADDCKSASIKWITEDLDVHHGGVVAHDGYIYAANYTSIRNGNWLCVDWETGELKYDFDWEGGKGSIIFSDGMLICYDERKGNVGLVEANPNGFNVKSSFTVEQGKGPHWSHPAIFDDKLLMRHGKSLMVYDISAD